MNSATLLGLTQFFTLFFLLPSSVERRVAGLDDCEAQSCGGVSISYPFWLGGRQPPHCGPPPFELACRGDGSSRAPVPVLRVISSSFLIKNIFYHNRSLHLTVDYIFEDDCPIPISNLTGDFYPFSTSSSNKMIFFLLGCSSSASLSSYQNITCPVRGRPAYFGGEYGGAGSPNPAGEPCNLVVVPTMDYAQGGYIDLLKAGYLVNWTAPDCTECEESGGQCGYDNSTATFMCICGGRSYPAGACRGHGRRRWTIIIIGSAFGGLGCLSLLLYLLFLCRRKVLDEKNNRAVKALLSLHGRSLTPKNYKYSEIKRMTKSFSSKLGQGGFGTVYKGTLPDGHQVAVKLLRTEDKGNGEEFVNEVVGISRTSHVNIVSLLGFCMERSKRALVYDFMPNGSLEKVISSEKGGGGGAPLGWEKLFNIVVGIGRGLEYLHRGCNTRIVHLDIKPHNVLLDEDFCPKISDFGLAKLCSPKESSGFSMAAPRGTAGYIAPEVFFRNFGTVSSKSDVYSYGMMVLELVGAMTTMKNDVQVPGMSSSTCSEFYFPHWIYDRLDDAANIFRLEGGLGTEEEEEMAKKMVIVGLWCIQMMPVNRPSMHAVVEMLEGRTEDLQLPPKP